MTRISFIMPSFNRAGYIAQSIESVLRQMGDDDELLVIDDGSTDAIAAAVAPFNARLRFVRQDNAGKSVALNRGLSMTDGDYVWICDDDDLLLPGALDGLLGTLESTGADVAFGRYTRFRHEAGRRVEMGTGYWPDLGHGSIARHILEDAFVMHNAALVRRSAYERAGPFDPAMLRSQDYEMFVRLALQSRIAFVDRLMFEQRKHEGARGPARIVHRPDRSDVVWERFDRRIFARLRDSVPVAWFEGLFEGDEPELVRRAGRLQRGCVMARHGLWDEALGDFDVAATIAPEKELHALERDICRRAVAGKHGIGGLLDRAALRSALALRATPVGRGIYGEIASGLVWRLRDRDRGVRRQALRYLVDPRAALAALRARAGAASADADPAGLHERAAPAPVDARVAEALKPALD